MPDPVIYAEQWTTGDAVVYAEQWGDGEEPADATDRIPKLRGPVRRTLPMTGPPLRGPALRGGD